MDDSQVYALREAAVRVAYPEIHRLLKESEAAYRRLEEARKEPRTASAALQVSRNADRALQEARDRAAREFASSRGWTFHARRSFTLEKLRDERANWSGDGYGLGSTLDHPDYFWLGRKPIALVSHTYTQLGRCLGWADAKQLHAELLPASWYYPAGATAVLYTRKTA
jgi:hypothetical protein